MTPGGKACSCVYAISFLLGTLLGTRFKASLVATCCASIAAAILTLLIDLKHKSGMGETFFHILVVVVALNIGYLFGNMLMEWAGSRRG